MSKYKLIKTYPGSPVLGTEVTNKNSSHDGRFYTEKGVLSVVDNPEKYPEFWEEIIENDYEILSLKYIDIIYSFKKGENYYSDKSCTGGYVNLKDTFNENLNYRAHIHSVKRLSDGE